MAIKEATKVIEVIEVIETISLGYQEGSSDKVYHCSIVEQSDGKYTVPFSYGRRGSTLIYGDKISGSPVSLDKAKKIYDGLVKEKLAKGYNVTGGSSESAPTGVHCQLLNAIDDDELEACLTNKDIFAQEKFDGKRMLLKREGKELIAINRKGLQCGFPAIYKKDLADIECDFIIDGESIGDVFHPFDVLSLNGKDITEDCYLLRYASLIRFCENVGDSIQIVRTETTTEGKRDLLAKLQKDRREGIVFKDSRAKYKAGRPNKGGTQLKYKFVESATCIVEYVNTKRSISLILANGVAGTGWTNVGNCTIPPNKKVPLVGEVVEIRYLYAYDAYEGGRLYQPVYIGVRDDLEHSDCNIKQLKYKAGSEEEDEE